MRFSPALFSLVSCLLLPSVSGAELVREIDPTAPGSSSPKPEWNTTEGPRPPMYPEFPADNAAILIGKTGPWPQIPSSPALRFGNGDTVTLEAWFQLSELGGGDHACLIGKGRTHRKGFPQNNQNYALRLRERDGAAHPDFLFASAGKWHRWTAEIGVSPGPGWHHVAVTYEFGRPESLAAFLDGKPIRGSWDMDGPTVSEPIQDDDELWLGASMGGSPAHRLKGRIDQARVWRGAVGESELRSRFVKVLPPPRPPVFETGRVRYELFREGGEPGAWPESVSGDPEMVWKSDRLVFTGTPEARDEWGLRADWPQTVLVRATAEMTVGTDAGRVLLRARGSSRLWIDGKLAVELRQNLKNTDGHNDVLPVPARPSATTRRAAYGDMEALIEINLAPGAHRFLLETQLGGKNRKANAGETLLAVENLSTGEFTPVGAEHLSPLTDEAWPEHAAAARSAMTQANREHRLAKAATMDAFWENRHAEAKRALAARPAVLPPPPTPGIPALNEIDHFINAKLARDLASASESPAQNPSDGRAIELLQEQCVRCHGEKDKGGLRLDTREHALREGDSGEAGLVPEHPERSALLHRIKLPADDEERMPPQGDPLSQEDIASLEAWIASGAHWPENLAVAPPPKPTPLTDDSSFLRRAWLDTTGIFPPPEEVRRFLGDKDPGKREKIIARLHEEDRWADHWVSYWQDVLAENPNILKPTLDNSGPFRFFLHEALLDRTPADRWVTELILMKGSAYQGGPAGFQLAAENDAPFAAKAHIVSSAFLGAQMKCARCHDAPFHHYSQRDLFALAAMLERKTVTVPPTSSVPAAFFERIKGRTPMIQVTLKPGEPVPPEWPLEEISPAGPAAKHATDPGDSRSLLAALITQPENSRFPEMMVNRIWKRLIGTGIVEPVDDWENARPSHPDLLRWLADEFIRSGYDTRAISRLIMNSHAWQRQASLLSAPPPAADPATRYFATPERRKMSAEQVVDSLFAASGAAMDCESLTFDKSGVIPFTVQNDLGVPEKGWQFSSISNERDRPSLNQPRSQAVMEILESFGWRPARPDPLTCRAEEPHALQPAIIANGSAASWLTRLTDDSPLTALCLSAPSPEALAEELFLRFAGRFPTAEELRAFGDELTPGFTTRLTETTARAAGDEPLPVVAWTNHLRTEANEIAIEKERRARRGPIPTARLHPEWRERAEDVIWSLLNAPELYLVP